MIEPKHCVEAIYKMLTEPENNYTPKQQKEIIEAVESKLKIKYMEIVANHEEGIKINLEAAEMFAVKDHC